MPRPGSPTVRQRLAVDRLVRWLVDHPDSGDDWDLLRCDLVCVGQDLRAQVQVIRGNETTVHPVATDGLRNPLRLRARALQRSGQDLLRGSWLGCSVLVAAGDPEEGFWARPQVEVVLNHLDPPSLPAHQPAPVAAEDYQRHLRRFPRLPRHTPSWLVETLNERGLSVPRR